MTPIEVIKDPHASPSSCWVAVEKLLGPGARAWEPETLHLELERRGIPWDGGVDAKVLGAQTILTTSAWTHDHDVLFAFAVACDGHPAGGAAHPTPAQLAWAVYEIEALTGGSIGEDEGFDPDGIDPAVALVLHDEGWVVAPEKLSFSQDALSRMNREGERLHKRVTEVWSKIKELPESSLRALIGRAPEDAIGVQIGRLADCDLELRERLRRRVLHDLGT